MKNFITLHQGTARLVCDGVDSGLLFVVPAKEPVVPAKAARIIKQRKKDYKTYQQSVFEYGLTDIAQIACDYYGIPLDKIKEHLKKSPDTVAKAKQLTSHLWGYSKEDHGIKYNALIVLFGYENHSIISKNRVKVTDLCRDKRSGVLFKHELREMEIEVVLGFQNRMVFPATVSTIKSVKKWSKIKTEETIQINSTVSSNKQLAKIINTKVDADKDRIVINGKWIIDL